MKRIARALTGALFLASAGSASAQTAVPIQAGSPDQAVLRTGTQVALKLSEQLTTKEKQARVGQRFQMEVAEPVTLQGQIVIPAGSPATGEIVDVRNKGMWGKSGHIAARVLYVRANGRQIRLTGTFDEKGTTGTAGVVAAIAFVPIAGFLTTGTSATIPVGAPVNAFIDEDIPVAFASTAPAPMVVTAVPAAAAAAPAPMPVPASTPASTARQPATTTKTDK
jgi:hypothetical protein